MKNTLMKKISKNNLVAALSGIIVGVIVSHDASLGVIAERDSLPC